MLDDYEPTPFSARLLRREAAHWRRMADCLDSNGDAIGAAELLSMADLNETIADRAEALA